MDKYQKSVEIIRRKIQENPNPIYRKAMEDCLHDLELMINNNDKELPSTTSELFQKYVKDVKQIAYERESKFLYNTLIERFISILNVLNIKDILSIFCFYRICLSDGILSNEGKFKYDRTLENKTNLAGSRIATGEGNSKDISSFLASIYRKLGYNAIAVPCLFTSDKPTNCVEALSEVKHNEENVEIYITLVSNNGFLFALDYLNKVCAINKHGDYFDMGKYKAIINTLEPEKMTKEEHKILNNIISGKLVPIEYEDIKLKLSDIYEIYYNCFNEVKMFSSVNGDIIKKLALYNHNK